MMRGLIGLTILIVLLLASTGFAVADTGFFSVGSFSSTYSAGALHTQFTLVQGNGIYVWSGMNWPSIPVAVEVVRHRISDPCGVESHVTYLPWDQQNQTLVTADIVDTEVQSNTTYEYLVYGIDGANGRMALAVMAGWSSTGVGFLFHATLSDGPDCGVSGVPHATGCYNECGGWVYLKSAPPESLPYFNTPTTLACYGEVDGLSPDLCNVVSPAVRITSVVEEDCTTAVHPVTWGAVKAMYK